MNASCTSGSTFSPAHAWNHEILLVALSAVAALDAAFNLHLLVEVAQAAALR